MADAWTLIWVAGPDTGAMVVLGCGAHIVGRAPGAAVRCDDGALEPHHMLIEISAEGATVRQLTGRIPVRVDGEPIANPKAIVAEARMEIGHSILRVHRGDLTAPGQGADRANNRDPANITVTHRGSVVVRCPRAAVTWNPDAVSPPTLRPARGETSGGILPAVLALAGSGLVAALLHQPMFLLFGALGAIVAFGTWGGQRITVFRRRRRDERARHDETAQFERAVEAQRAGFIAHCSASISTPVSAIFAIERQTSDLWARRGTHPDGFAVSIGLGSIPWAPRLEDGPGVNRAPESLGAISMLADLPIVADIGAACRLAVRGDADRARAVARSIVVQLAANCGPADVRFVVVTHEPAQWRWLERLPHATTAAGLIAVVGESELLETVAEADVAPHPHLVVITDTPELLAARTGPLRRVVTADRSVPLVADRAVPVVADRSVALIVLVGAEGGIPHVCSSLLDLSGPMRARWHADAAIASLPVQVRCSGISERSAARLAGGLSGLVDPEDPLGAAGGIPREVTMLSLLPSHEPAAIAASWVAGGVDPLPRTVIGVAGDGVVDVDLERDGPHALMAGTTGSGKSELLRALVVGLATGSSPDHLTFVPIDYKGGSTFDACAELPHVVGVVTDLDDHLANRALRCLHAELRRREQLLRVVGAADLPAYRRLAPKELLPRLVVVIDEFAALVNEQPDFLHALVGIAQRGRSLGVHLILATQRPSGVISDDIRANTNLRLALRLHDSADAMDVVGDRAPASIPRGLAGRAVMRLGPDEVLTFQTARCTAPLANGGTELDVLVAAVRDAAALVGARRPDSPWLAPLPAHLPVDEAAVGRGIVGLVDDPDGQRVVPLRWDRSEGHLLLVGAAGSGVTSTLVLLGTVAATDGSGCHLYVIDGRGDQALGMFEHSPWCGGVVRLHERERLIRLINRLADEVSRRIAHPTLPRYPTVVLVDGLDAVRTTLDDLETAAELEMLDTIIALGAAHDVVVVCAFDRVAAIPSSVLARCAQRWIFHLTDPLDAAGLGIATADVPGPQAGRIVVASSGLEAQLMVGAPPLLACVDGPVPSPVECLPAELDAIDLPPGVGYGDDSLLPLGLRFGDGQVCSVDVPDGEHLLIIGPPRSGRSTALQRMVRAWRDAYPDGWWRIVAPRRTVLDGKHRHRSLVEIIGGVPSDGRVLIAIDDAELVDDVGGALTSLAASRQHGLMIIATGKPDSLRQSYGHWTGVVRRSRLGIVTTAANDLDGDLVGAVLPRRLPIAARPGLVWLVSDGSVVLTQVAVDQHGPAELTALVSNPVIP
ncbi:MAG: FtsK/SpoIIIE domain-containing protein [Actinomycetota bacterium]|nr:FtsK/SpoIIIE domain-containing protein [Actinomycetota bacterium]